MAIAKQTMTDEQRKSVALEYLKAFDNGDLSRADLERRLEEIFRTRHYRYIFLIADPDLQFAEVAQVIDSAAKQVDYISLVPPSVLKQIEVSCFDPRLPETYLAHPTRH